MHCCAVCGLFSTSCCTQEQRPEMVPHCTVFMDHTAGDDGLWVVEEPSAEGMEKAKAELTAAGQKIYYEKGFSFVASGGTDLPNITGLDGCGASPDTYIIPVPSHSVHPPQLSDARGPLRLSRILMSRMWWPRSPLKTWPPLLQYYRASTAATRTLPLCTMHPLI